MQKGEVSLEDYLGNGLADTMAKVATRVGMLSPEAGHHVEQIAALAFLMCIRIAIIE